MWHGAPLAMLGAMRRSTYLAPLSREHHSALEHALRLRRATPDTVEHRVRRFADYFAADGRRHLADEERRLLPLLSGREAGRRLAERLLAEHAELRCGADDVTGRPGDVAAAQRLGELLYAHVRFEERELFRWVEAEHGL